MKVTSPIDPEIAALVDVPRGKLVSPGSDVAVSAIAPVVTGDAAMDTQLENLRMLLCDSVVSTYAKVTRARNVRLWPMRHHFGDQSKIVEPTTTRKDDHPAIQNLIQMAAALARIDAMECTKRDDHGQTYVSDELLLQRERLRVDLFTKIQSALKDIDKSGQDAIKLASDTVKSFHAMAQQWKIHTTKQQPLRHGQHADLQALAAIAFSKKDPPA